MLQIFSLFSEMIRMMFCVQILSATFLSFWQGDLLALAEEISNYAAIKVSCNGYHFLSNKICVDCSHVSTHYRGQRIHFLQHNPELLNKILYGIRNYSSSLNPSSHLCRLCNKLIAGSTFKMKYHFIFTHLVNCKNFQPRMELIKEEEY